MTILTHEQAKALLDLTGQALQTLAFNAANKAAGARAALQAFQEAPDELRRTAPAGTRELLVRQAESWQAMADSLSARPERHMTFELVLVPVNEDGEDAPPMAKAAVVGTHHTMLALQVGEA